MGCGRDAGEACAAAIDDSEFAGECHAMSLRGRGQFGEIKRSVGINLKRLIVQEILGEHFDRTAHGIGSDHHLAAAHQQAVGHCDARTPRAGDGCDRGDDDTDPR